MATNYDAKIAADYANKWLHDSPRRMHLIYHTWQESLGNVKGLRVADLACGAGATARMLAEKGAKVIGIDLSLYQLEYAKKEEKKHPMGILYIKGDLRDAAKLPDVGIFDLVTPTFLFNYANDANELMSFAKSCAFLLRKGGKMCGITINPFNPTEKPIDGEGANVEWLKTEEIGKEGGKINVQLYDEHGQTIAPFVVHFFSSKLYEFI